MAMYFEEVRRNLLFEAQASPNLLSDLAGLEKYIAESYHNRSFIELLQNADDAEATKFKVLKDGELLFVANNGRVFTQQDLESLCRSASSKKIRGKTIGYRGIGFKSVVGFAQEIHVLSGELEITFSKTRTQSEIPQASRVPLIRIPHIISESDKELIHPIQSTLQSEGYSTIFVFTGITADEIESEFDSFGYNSLIFLRNVVETEISLIEPVITKITKNQLPGSFLSMTFGINGNISNWLISQERESSIAFSIQDNQVVKLPQDESLIHAFLPTVECNGMGVLINGNFSTDPSRRHVIFDTETLESLKQCSNHISRVLENNLKSDTKDSINIVNTLVPYSDPRTHQFKKDSFVKLLLENIQKRKSTFFRELKLCPNWFNTKDFSMLMNTTNANVINSHFYELEGFNAFAKYLGATECTLRDIEPKINDTELSFLGCVQLTKHIFTTILIYNEIDESEFLDLKVIHSQGKRISLKELRSNTLRLDEPFISLLLEYGMTESEIKQVLKRFLSNTAVEGQFNETITETQKSELESGSVLINAWFNKSQEISKKQIKESIKRWRSAEEQTLEILNLNGFKLEDVSKQNIGYDLVGKDPNDNEIQIEVKSITLLGQKFRLTNNEIAVAQEKQKSYYVAIVRQTENALEIALISDPVNNLTLNRQCVQWIWECESYEYTPIKFEI